jgi:Fic family protein
MKNQHEETIGVVHYHTGHFPPTDINWSELVSFIGKANGAVARYDGLLKAIPNPTVLLSPLMTNEAVLSSRIEGTQATLNEVLTYEAQEKDRLSPQSPKDADMQEISNYRQAMRFAEQKLEELPLSQRLIKDAHEILLSGVRGQNKAPGKYRSIPNWIGPVGCVMDDARYVPPDANTLPDSMSVWEKYIHTEERDPLVQLAVIHAEFEALHPFLDGNGRLGRMIIPLFLYQVRILQRPAFYISAYLEAHRNIYYEKLLAVSRDNDWMGWCRFFLEAIQIQSEDNFNKATKILDLYNEMKLRLAKATESKYAIHTLEWIFGNPVFSMSTFIQRTKIPRSTATRIVQRLADDGTLSQIRAASGRSPAIMAFDALLNTVA